MKNWKELGWEHPLWDITRYILSIRGAVQKEKTFKSILEHRGILLEDAQIIPLDPEVVDLIVLYFDEREIMLSEKLSCLRSEKEAQEFCQNNDYSFGFTKTRSGDHHQSSKSLIASVNGVTEEITKELNISFEPDPQKRCVWFYDKGLHVTARNLDGAIPSLTNPYMIWEIKEYWGKTKGGSKMSDAVYECQLVGRELREFEKEYSQKIHHIVFLDGKDQWGYRKSDLGRFIDLENQGIIDRLFVGRDVEDYWAGYIREALSDIKK